MDKIILPLDDDELLAQCLVQTYRSSGPGGQHVNVTDSAVRLKHIPSGMVVACQQERSQHLNKKLCLIRLREKIEKLNFRKKKRLCTKIPRRVKSENRVQKMHASEKKRLRRPLQSSGD